MVTNFQMTAIEKILSAVPCYIEPLNPHFVQLTNQQIKFTPYDVIISAACLILFSLDNAIGFHSML